MSRTAAASASASCRRESAERPARGRNRSTCAITSAPLPAATDLAVPVRPAALRRTGWRNLGLAWAWRRLWGRFLAGTRLPIGSARSRRLWRFFGPLCAPAFPRLPAGTAAIELLTLERTTIPVAATTLGTISPRAALPGAHLRRQRYAVRLLPRCPSLAALARLDGSRARAFVSVLSREALVPAVEILLLLGVLVLLPRIAMFAAGSPIASFRFALAAGAVAITARPPAGLSRAFERSRPAPVALAIALRVLR